MEKEYNKIGNIFKFDEKYKNIVGLNEPYNTLKDIVWQGTEKIDGTNIRIYWDGHTIEIAGRTNKSLIPQKLQAYLDSVFKVQEMEYVFEQLFGNKEVYIFGEGYGCGIQLDGGDYLENSNETSFIVFDIQINGYDLNRENTTNLANKLGLKAVPVVFEGTLEEAKEFVGKHQKSTLNNGKREMEGLILVPRDIELYDKNHNLIKCKCKYRDMLKANLIKGE